MSDNVTLREFLVSIMDERDRRYAAQFAAQETAVSAALTAQKELTNAAFTASEKAIVKAEDAQREYNARSNEFRGQLDDQNKDMIRRSEADIRFQQQDEKTESIKKEVADLRESRSAGMGKQSASVYIVGVLIALLSIALHFLPSKG